MIPTPVPPPVSRTVPTARMLSRYARGFMPSFPDARTGCVTWCRTSHRGVQFLDQIHIPKKQRQYVFSKRFEVRYNTAFEAVVRHCADPTRDAERTTWLSTGLVEGLVALHRRGFASSFEAWEGGELVGGGFGVLIGGFVSVDSMFHLTDDASKAAYVQMLLGLRDRGFGVVDVNEPSPFMARWGAKWVPAWQFDALQREAMGREVTFLDGRPAPRLPRALRLTLAARRVRLALARRVGLETRWPQTKPAAAEAVLRPASTEAPLDPRVDLDVLLDPPAVARERAATSVSMTRAR